jgi:hypothetical protein
MFWDQVLRPNLTRGKGWNFIPLPKKGPITYSRSFFDVVPVQHAECFFLLLLQFNRSDVSSFCPYSLRLSKPATFSVFPRPSPLVGRSSSPASALPH